MAIPFSVPSRSFPSRKAAKEAIRFEVLHAYPVRKPIPVGPHHTLLSEVLRLHSDAEEKIGPGIDHFYVQETWRLLGKEAVGKDQRAIIVVRTDGSERDWSYHHVIDAPSAQANVKSALAFAIDDGRIRRRDSDFASGATIYCAITGVVIEQKHQADTRHLAPTWNELTAEFVAEHGGWDAIETHSGNGYVFVGRDIEDVALRDSWLDFYGRKARPQYVKNESLPRL